MIADKLEIFVFTYNRGESLKRLLLTFRNSPFASCRLTVLDNASTDSTAAVIAEISGSYPTLRHVRHPKNIGGLANYLRAVELASAPYTWILCDDDAYHLDQTEDLLKAIEEGVSELISVGVEDHQLPHGYLGGLTALAADYPYFISHSFVPSLIFRTSVFTNEIIREAYDNVHTMFPHFPFLARMAEQNVSIYVSTEKVITKSQNVGYSRMRFLRGWLLSCMVLRTPWLKKKALSEVFGGKTFFYMFVYCLLTERQFRRPHFREEFFALWRDALFRAPLLWLKLTGAIPLVLAPDPVHRLLWDRYSRYRARRGEAPQEFDAER